MADFKNRLISRIFGVFCSGFFHRTTLVFLYNRFAHAFGHFLFLTQTEHLAKAIAFARWPIFKILSFLEYLGVFAAVFCTEQLWCAYRYVFRTFLDILIFDPN